MARKSLRPQLNQIRAWAREGRTDAWIAHQLDVSTSQLRDFRRRNGLSDGEEGPPADIDLRDEIEAEIEAADDEEEPEDEGDDSNVDGDEENGESRESSEDGERGGGSSDRPQRRRRRRRGGRGRRKRGPLEASFDHGKEGYGLWLDPAVKDDPIYSEHWAGKRAVKVTIEAERIVIEPVEPAAKNGADEGEDD